MRALPHPQRDQRPDAELTADELEAALELLSTEAETQESDRHSLLIELLENILVGCLLFGLPVGLLVIAFDLWWGIGLLLTAVVAFVLLAVAPASKISADMTQVRSSIGDTELYKVADEVLTSRRSWKNTLVLILSPLAVVGGAAWLLYGLIADGEVRVLPLVVIALPSLAFWVVLALDSLQELKYYRRVGSIRDRFQERAGSAGEGEAAITVSGDELNLLAKAEVRQTHRAVNEAAEQLPVELEQSYAVAVTPEAMKELEQLHLESASEWLHVQQTILSLQDDPRPTSAMPTVETPGALTVLAGQHGVGYVVDDERQSVSVVAIDERGTSRKPDDAA